MNKYEKRFNPYVETYENNTLQIRKLRIEKDQIAANLKWIKIKNIDELYNIIETLSKRSKIKNEEIERLNDKILSITKSKIRIEKELKSPLNPKYHFSDNQKRLRKERDTVENSIKNLNSAIKSRLEIIKKTKQHQDKIQSDIKRYKSLDIFNLEEKLSNTTLKIEELTTMLESIVKKKTKIEVQLKPTINELNRINLEIEKANSIIARAEKFNSELDNATSGYERALIHQNCEEELGDSKPSRIIKTNKEKNIAQKRSIEKLITRANVVKNRAIRTIDEIIIDGNNMAYENNKFIGLKALLPTTRVLDSSYKVTVFFDSEICSQLKSDKPSIIKQFKSSVTVHIVAEGEKADEPILNLASGQKNSYVISNDKFVDYFDKEAVSSKRLLTHEITNNTVMINDLDIRVQF